jgi:hypothetical protein
MADLQCIKYSIGVSWPVLASTLLQTTVPRCGVAPLSIQNVTSAGFTFFALTPAGGVLKMADYKSIFIFKKFRLHLCVMDGLHDA